MKKSVLIKGILLLVVVGLLAIGFTGCGGSIIFYASYIYIDSMDGIYGYVYLDNTYIGYLYSYDYVTAYNVSYGPHTVSIYPLGFFYSNYNINVSGTGQNFYIYW